MTNPPNQARRARALDRRPPEHTLRLREPVDVLGAIPFLVGYHPDGSVVVIGLRGKRLEFTLRIDLPPEETEPAEIRQVWERICATLTEHRVTGALFVGYGSDQAVGPLFRGLRRACEAAGIAVKESLRSQHGRYWSYLCRNPRCCPPEGTPYDPRGGIVAAEATLAGRVALPDFDAYAAQLEPVDRPADSADISRRMTARLVDLLAEAGSEGEALRDLLAATEAAITEALELTRAGASLGDEELVWLSVLVMAHPARDEACEGILRQARHDLQAHRSLWLDVMRRCDPDLVPGPATLFALAAWRCGDTKLAGLALERALEHEPDYLLALELLECIRRGVAPAALTARRDDRHGISRRSARRGGAERSEMRPRRGRAARRRSASRRAGSQPT